MSTELVELRSYYAAPGSLLLVRVAGQPAGCVGISALDRATGELRRLFVRPEHRGRALGRALLHSATDRARRHGLSRLVLTTLPTMTQARMLYDADGYAPIEPYVAEPVEGVRYLGRRL